MIGHILARQQRTACLVLVTALLSILPTSSEAGQSSFANERLDRRCRNGTLEGRIIDPQGSAVPGAWVELLVLNDVDFHPEPAATLTTGDDGRFAIACPSLHLFVIRVSAPGFNSVTLRYDDRIFADDDVIVRLGVETGEVQGDGNTLLPCPEGAPPSVELTADDRAAIYSLVLAKAFRERGGLVLASGSVLDVRSSVALPPNVEFIDELTLRRRSNRRTVNFVKINEIEVQGSCVLAGYYATCMHREEICNMCCSAETYLFYRRDGQWRCNQYSGVVI